MDLNLNFAIPLCPPPLSVDLGYDLALDALPFSSSEIDHVLMRLPSIDALVPLDEIPNPDNVFEPFDLPSFNYDITPSHPSEERRNNALNSMPNSPPLMLDSETLAPTGWPTSRRELLEYPEFRFRRLFESRNRWQMARTRSNREESDRDAHSPTDPERLMRDIRRSGRLVGSVGKRKASENAPRLEGSAEEKKEKDGIASDFDCNVCFEVAKEPVVTCCGHLFCWPCLYQWLHVHCEYKECPVCKGKVNESSVVPIFGRGSSEASEARMNAEDGDQGLKIPPRPQGSRVESFRQQLRGPLLTGPETWLLQEVQQLFNELPESLRLLRREDRRPLQTPPINFQSVPPESLRLLQRGEGGRNPPPSPPINFQPIPPLTAASLLQTTAPPQLSSLQNSTLELLNFSVEHRSTTRRRERPVTITISDDLPDPAPSLSQASTSSTMAMIQGEIAVPDPSLEPEMGGTSMVLRRRTRSRASGSSGGSEQVPQLRQRRRMN